MTAEQTLLTSLTMAEHGELLFDQMKRRMKQLFKMAHRYVCDVAAELNIGHHAVQEMLENLGYPQVCARWAPTMLIYDHKQTRQKFQHSSCKSILPYEMNFC